jgi:hypothetical protein
MGEEVLDSKPKPKDIWDKLDAFSGVLTFASSLAIAGVGGFFTLTFKATEERVAELTVVEKMIPHLGKDGRETQAALALMATLSRPDVAAEMAKLYGGKESIESMKRLAVNAPTDEGRKAAKQALDALSSQGTAEEAKAAAAAKSVVLAAAATGNSAATGSLSTESSPVAVPKEEVFVVSSGPLLSGAGKSFSSPYPLCADAPAGYKITKAEFRLVGDRSCGGWAECAEVSRTETRVCYQFRLQGHDELPSPGQRTSEGILKIVATKQPA